MRTYLVTGGAGFIGSNFIELMLKKYKDKIHIINVDKLTYAGNLENLKKVENESNYIFIKGDICYQKLINEIFCNYDIDYVVNFAAESHVDRSIHNPSVFVETNILGTQNLLDSAKKAWETEKGYKKGKKFLQISTDEVYGSLDNDKDYFIEETPLDPHSPYSASKASADLIVKAYYDTYKMPINITRCTNNYGPYQFPEKLIPLIINNCLINKTLPIYGDGNNVRDWIYIDDHCYAIDEVLHKGDVGQVYNIGSNNEKQNIEIVKIIIETLRNLLPENDNRKSYITEDLIEYVQDRKGHDRRYAIDSSKIKRSLDWKPKVNFQEGIEKTIRWYLENEQWIKNITTGQYEQYYKNMYKK